jgi:hypothetical protein
MNLNIYKDDIYNKKLINCGKKVRINTLSIREDRFLRRQTGSRRGFDKQEHIFLQ